MEADETHAVRVVRGTPLEVHAACCSLQIRQQTASLNRHAEVGAVQWRIRRQAEECAEEPSS